MLLILLAACHPNDGVAIHAPTGAPLDDFVRFLGDDRVTLSDASPTRRDLDITVDLTDDCGGCYALTADGDDLVVEGDLLGVQYGLTDALERMGFGFHHPYDTERPEALSPPDALPDGVVSPERSRRGIHLHTLHPIEGLEACYIPDDDEKCQMVIDWLVKNRGNYLGYPALDDLVRPSFDLAGWQDFTQDIADAAHARGVTLGVGVQLLGASNLQQAFDLVDGSPDDVDAAAASMDERLTALSPINWDTVELSFGEFSGVEPETFIAAVELGWERIDAAMPGVEVVSVIHVGNYEDLQVTWEGDETLYYFLATYADAPIRPWIHSVMYYNLYDDAGGAYLHDEFDLHRAFLEDALAAGEPVGYFPETAYWIAFDNSVPMFLPVYLYSRWKDLSELPNLDDHVLFSTGWEWGYWLNDAAALRMSHTLQPWEEVATGLLGEQTGGVVAALGELQRAALIDGRLAAYVAGRDALIDAGDRVGIIAAPDRVTFSELYAADAATRAAFAEDVAVPLAAFGDAIDALARPSGDRWADEVADGVEIDALRARYAARLYEAVLTAADGGDPSAAMDEADDLLDEAAVVVARRAAAFHDPDGAVWTAERWDNPTIYDYGYLREADTLCFWWRERAQVRELLLGTDEDTPGCVL